MGDTEKCIESENGRANKLHAEKKSVGMQNGEIYLFERTDCLSLVRHLPVAQYPQNVITALPFDNFNGLVNDGFERSRTGQLKLACRVLVLHDNLLETAARSVYAVLGKRSYLMERNTNYFSIKSKKP